MAATLATEEVFSAFLGEYEEFKSFFHGHTYTGNALGCALGLASLDLFRTEGTLEKLHPKVLYLRRRLEKEFLSLDHVGDIRQWGFMVGIELVDNKSTLGAYPPASRIGHRVVLEARQRGVIVRPLGDVIILIPPLTISEDELELLLDVVYQSIKAVTEG